MRIYKALNTEVRHGREFRANSVILEADNGVVLVSNDFHHSRKQDLALFVWIPKDRTWYKTCARNKYTEAMWDYWCRNKPKKKRNHIDYAGMMRHTRMHKGGGGGSREFVGAITDYECTKNPMHDFRRCYN